MNKIYEFAYLPDSEISKLEIDGIIRQIGTRLGGKRLCYDGCKDVNPHFARLCNEPGDYHEKCLTNKRLREEDK